MFFIYATIADRNVSPIRGDAPSALGKLIDISKCTVWIDAPHGERYHLDQFEVMLFEYATTPTFPQAVSVLI